MQSDLCFRDWAAEHQFRRQADSGGVRVAAAAAAVHTMVWSGLSARLWAFGHDWSAFLAALAVLTSAAYLAATWLAGRCALCRVQLSFCFRFHIAACLPPEPIQL